MLTVNIIPNDKNNPPGKLADAELHFIGPWDERVGEHHAIRDVTCAAPTSVLDGVAYVNQSRAHCIATVKHSVVVHDRRTHQERRFEAQRRIAIDISPNSGVELLG